MRILHALYGLERNSGVSVFAAELGAIQAANGNEVTLVGEHNFGYSVNERVRFRLMKMPAPDDVTPYDMVHIHALWSMWSVNWMRWCRRQKLPYVVSPHGGLMPRVFTRGRIKKLLFWQLLLKPLLKRAKAIHCTGEAEVEACRRLGLKGPFVIAPLGVPKRTLLKRDNPNDKTVLFLGRLGEEKGLVGLLEAWKRVQKVKGSEVWNLVLAGPDWEGLKKILEQKIAAEGIKRVTFAGEANPEKKDRLYREADVFVLPSPMENFSHVVIEALSYGLPVIATKGTPWRELVQGEGAENWPGRSGWWIDQGVGPLVEALQEAMKLSDAERAALGANGRTLVERKYTWEKVEELMRDAYR